MAKLEDYLLQAGNPVGNKQRNAAKHKRGGEELTREQVRAIKKGRKLLRKEMRRQGLKDKPSFELTASNLGLYFDKPPFIVWLKWFLHGKGLAALIGATALLLTALFLYASVTQMRGHFTINMSNSMFKEGFVLSEKVDFVQKQTHLFSTPADSVPCISISHLPEDLNMIDGSHNAEYFAYTFYCRNEGESVVDYNWRINLTGESQGVSEACWVMLFEDGKMTFYAAPNGETGEAEVIPAYDDDTRGYIGKPLGDLCKNPEEQYQTIAESRGFTYERVIPISFEDGGVVARGVQTEVKPLEMHKYTVVIWLEGDDPDCTDDLIGGHLGMEFYMNLVTDEDGGGGEGSNTADMNSFWDNLKFWKK